MANASAPSAKTNQAARGTLLAVVAATIFLKGEGLAVIMRRTFRCSPFLRPALIFHPPAFRQRGDLGRHPEPDRFAVLRPVIVGGSRQNEPRHVLDHRERANT